MNLSEQDVTNIPTYLPYLPTFPPTNQPVIFLLHFNEFKKAAATEVRRPS